MSGVLVLPPAKLILPKKQAVLIRAYEKTIVGPGSCLLYQGRHSGNGRGGGYPRTEYLGQTVGLHIFGFECYHGRRVRTGRKLDHLCECRNCWNPYHLEEVTQSTNEKRKHRRRKHAPELLPAQWIQDQFQYSLGQALAMIMETSDVGQI